LNNKLGIGLNELADMLGVDKTSLYKLVKRVESEHRVAITNPQTKKVEVVEVTPEQLINIVESEVLQISARQKIADPFLSSIIKEFWEKPIQRQSSIDRRAYYNEKEKREAIQVVRELMNTAINNNLPSNPDFWDRETLLRLIDLSYSGVSKRLKRQKILYLRRIPQFRTYLEGLVGSVKRYIETKTSALFYEHYLKLKELWNSGLINTEDFLLIWLHITTGVREGWGSEVTKLSDDLDNAKTSLVGLKWENLEFIADTVVLKIYEHKTQKVWRADLRWLDPEIVNVFLKYRQDKGSIIKTLSKCKTVKEFRRYYEKLLERISKLLNLQFKLTPHDLRRSHISILAELGIPMEISCSGLLDFGVGWEDLSTALIFYTRFSRYVKEKLLEEASKRKKEIEEKIKIK